MSKRLMKSYAIVFIVVILLTTIIGAVIYRPSIHNAEYAEILEIDDIGIVLTERIVEYLEDNPNCKIEDLTEINGIGEIRLSNLRKEFRWRNISCTNLQL